MILTTILKGLLNMNKFEKNMKKQQGFTLVELMLSLAAIVALTAIVFYVFPKVMASRNATYESQVLSTATASVKSLYTSGIYSTLSTAVAANGKFFPDSMISGTTIKNQWNGDVKVGGVAAGAVKVAGTATNSSDTRLFGISYADVPSAVCIKLAGAAAPNFERIVIGTTQVKDTLPGTTDQKSFEEDKAATACNPSNASPSVDMVFITQ